MKQFMNCTQRLVLSLTVTVALTVLLTQVPSQAVRLSSGIILSFLVPGYLLLEFLWPNGKGIDGTWRLILIVPASIALVGGILLLVTYFWVYQYEWAVVLVALMNGILAMLGYLRCRSTSPDERQGSNWRTYLDRVVQDYSPNGWHALLAFSLLVLFGSIVYASVTPRKIPTLTEFYVLKENGDLLVSMDYIRDPGTILKYGIGNHEGKTMQYRLVVVADTPESSTELWSESITVPEDTTVEGLMDLSSKPADTNELRLLLYLPNSADAYRSLRLVLDEW